jgi:exonuclease III
MVDAWRQLHPDEQTYTFTPGGAQGRAVYRRLDYVFMSEELFPWTESMELNHTHMSDHKSMKLVLRPQRQRPPFEYGSTKTIFSKIRRLC